ncbi:hypothetical protein [Saltatorellus ferox]|uniref:hypothetical protein n=1 Tax=Saltatorellus ferox TaxID=2528018 RepID=UPI003AF348B2
MTDSQVALQADLSCLVDGELDEVAAARAMVRLEDSAECQIFLDDIRRFARLHRDLSDPQRLEARIAMLGAGEIAKAAENIDLAHRLATIFYQLGKAYTLSAIDGPGFRERVFEAAVPVQDAKTQGRGFVDGVVSSGRADEAHSAEAVGAMEMGEERSTWGGRSDWLEARHLLNGRLEQIADPLEKGRRLLSQSIEIDPSHEEARIYLAYVYSREGKKLKAASLYRDVFDTALSLSNRGHAAMQLGRLHFLEGDVHEALILWRWMNISGLSSDEARFNVVRFNIGVAYAQQGRDQRALDSFRDLLDAQLRAGGEASDIAALFVENPDARKIFEARPGFLAQLMKQLPELFEANEVSKS